MIAAKTKIALVTGGSSGIGLAIAHELAKRGNNLLLVSNQEKELAEISIKIENANSVKCYTLFANLAKPEAAYEIFEHCAKEDFDVEILVNNAGMLLFSEVVSADPARIDAKLQLHIVTPTLLCRLFGEQMKSNRFGYILNVSSISAVMPYPGISLYGPTKTYLRYFTRALHTEMGAHKVNVCCLIPGATATGLYDPKKINLALALSLGLMHQPEFVASKAMKSLYSNSSECIPGILNKIIVFIFPIIPAFIISFIYRKTALFGRGVLALG